MSENYEPGTVAVATVRGVPNVRVAYADPDDPGCPWVILTGKHVGEWETTKHVTDVRPLVVLDLDEFPILRNPSGMEHWSADVRTERPGMAAFFTKLGETIEAQTKPPRIPEPGLWAVVEAGVRQHDVRLRWVRLGDNYRPETPDEYDRLWSDLIDPVLVRDGIES